MQLLCRSKCDDYGTDTHTPVDIINIILHTHYLAYQVSISCRRFAFFSHPIRRVLFLSFSITYARKCWTATGGEDDIISTDQIWIALQSVFVCVWNLNCNRFKILLLLFAIPIHIFSKAAVLSTYSGYSVSHMFILFFFTANTQNAKEETKK